MSGGRHVLQVFQPDWGGVPVYVASVAEGLLERGWAVSVAAPPEHPARERIAALGVMTVPIRSRNGSSPRADRDAVRDLAAHCRRTGVDVVHGHSSKAGLLVALAARRAGVPSLYTPHTWSFQREGSIAVRAAFAGIEAALVRGAHDAVVAVSDSELAAARRWHVLGQGGTAVVARTGLPDRTSGLDRAAARAALGLDPAVPVVAWVGRRDPAKRPQDLAPLARELEGVARVVALGQRLPETPEADALTAAGGRVLEDEDPATVYAAADAFVLTSAWEALPLSVLEAMQAGLPVVAYDVGDLGHQVLEGRTGHLVAPFDTAALADRLRAILADAVLRGSMGRAARLHVARNFSSTSMLDVLERTYLELTPAGAARSGTSAVRRLRTRPRSSPRDRGGSRRAA